MACKALTTNILKSQRYWFSSQAAAAVKPTPAAKKQNVEVSVLPNGLKIVSLENFSPISRIALLVKAGSRYEFTGGTGIDECGEPVDEGNNEGITHCLRNSAGLSTAECTTFGITRNVQQIGSNLVCTNTREYLMYSMECIRDCLDTGVDFLKTVSTKQVFKPWELGDNLYRMKLDLALLKEQPYVLLLERLHKAAFRIGLGNSLYTPPHMLGRHNTEMLMQFVNNHFLSNRMALVGVGVTHDKLLDYAGGVFQHLESGEGPAKVPTKYGGGEIRENTGGPLAYVALASQGVSYKNPKEYFAAAVLQNILGTGPNVKYGDSVLKLAQGVSSAVENPWLISCLNINYSDSGLFGFYAAGRPEDMGQIMKSAVETMKSVSSQGVSDAEFNCAKHKLKSTIMLSLEHGTSYLEELGVQALATGKVMDAEEMAQSVDAVTLADVHAVSKKILSSKPTMAAVGNLSFTPYLDELR